MRGCNQFKLGNVNAAVQDWQAFLQLKPDKEAEHWQICVGFALLGHYEEARKRFDWHATTKHAGFGSGLLAFPVCGPHGRVWRLPATVLNLLPKRSACQWPNLRVVRRQRDGVGCVVSRGARPRTKPSAPNANFSRTIIWGCCVNPRVNSMMPSNRFSRRLPLPKPTTVLLATAPAANSAAVILPASIFSRLTSA